MAILDIRTYPDPVLAQKAVPVETFDASLQQLMQDMAETMYAAPGIGLAAPQVGVGIRAIVIDASPRVEESGLITFINPVITFAEGESVCEEGCLSVPNFVADVVRASNIRVEGFDQYGKPLIIESDTFLATVLQHEIDHLEGVLFIDHIGRLKRDMVRRRLRKQARKTKKQQTIL